MGGLRPAGGREVRVRRVLRRRRGHGHVPRPPHGGQDSHSAVLGHSESWADNKRIRIVFTVPSDGVVRLIFRGRIGKDTAFYQIICTEAGSDESFFTGSTMPLNIN